MLSLDTSQKSNIHQKSYSEVDKNCKQYKDSQLKVSNWYLSIFLKKWFFRPKRGCGGLD